MHTNKLSTACIFLLLALMSLSCNDKDVFDEEEYKKLVEIAQPVEGIDADHTWSLTTTYYLVVDIGEEFAGNERLQILSGNPVVGESAVVLGDYPVSGGGKKYIAFTAPSTMTKFFAALIDAQGIYTVTSFPNTQRTVTFPQSSMSRGPVDDRLVSQQALSFCYEDEMPEPGDYDYNDVVLRISQERIAQNQIMLNVTLAAVGSMKQVAGALCLANYKYDDIESVTTVDGETFDDGYKKPSLCFIKGDDLLLKGIDSVAVINLFEDAHWATGVAEYASEGYVERYMYNVSKETGSSYDMMSPRTISYIVTFRNTSSLDYFTLDQIDPFIIIEYMGSFMEVHPFHYRTQTALYDYSQPTSANILPWALVVPGSSFRYPLDGVNIGFAKNGALFGAYMTEGHSFGEWAANHTIAIDWYDYPTGNQVF